MKLVVFDLDTALCQTSAMDGLAMASAIKDVAGCHIESEVFDSIHEVKSLWYHATSRMADLADLAELRQRYAVHFRRQFLIRPRVVNSDPALIDHINYIQESNNTVVGIVTATTQSVLLLKARAAGIRCESMPMATGDDADTLDSLLNVLRTRVSRSYGYHCGECIMVGSEHWQTAADRMKMLHLSVDEYASVYANEKPKRHSLLQRSREMFSFS